MAKQLIPTEEQEQKCLVNYLELKRYTFTAIPNSTYTTSWNQKRKNKDMGLRPGLPDLLIIINNRLVFIELKRKKGGSASPAQKEWIESLNNCPGVTARICKGSAEAIEFLEQYALS